MGARSKDTDSPGSRLAVILNEIAQRAKIAMGESSLEAVATEIDIDPGSLRNSISVGNKQRMGLEKIMQLCEIAGVTDDELIEVQVAYMMTLGKKKGGTLVYVGLLKRVASRLSKREIDKLPLLKAWLKEQG